MSRIKIYTAQRMTGRMQDEMRYEAEMLNRVLANHNFECISAVLEENIPYLHEPLADVPAERLQTYWKKDKQLIREADLVLDYQTQNKSDGANKEIAYARYCLWKPVIRVWNGPGGLISQMEDDMVVPTLTDAMAVILNDFGTYEKLGQWRRDMWNRCIGKWLDYQVSMNARYGSPISVEKEIV